ncbi:MAG: hypothetical protein ACQESG_01225 [Nanobdellota archaeon]
MKEDVIVSILKAEKNAHRAIKSARSRYEKKLASEKERLRSEYTKRVQEREEELALKLQQYKEGLPQSSEAPQEQIDNEVEDVSKKVLEVLLSGN